MEKKYQIIDDQIKIIDQTIELGHDMSMIKNMIKDTEDIRLERLLLFVGTNKNEKVRRQAIGLLLKYFDKLNNANCAFVINQANEMIKDSKVDDDVRVKLIADLQNAISTSTGKVGKIKNLGFEQLRMQKGVIDLDDD